MSRFTVDALIQLAMYIVAFGTSYIVAFVLARGVAMLFLSDAIQAGGSETMQIV